MAATLKLDIVTPEGRVYTDNVDMVVLPASEGEMGVYPMHVPLMTQIIPGELTIYKGGKPHFFAVGEGFVEITQDHISVLADMAIEEQQISESAAEEAIRRAEALLAQNHLGAEELATVQASIQKSLAQLHVKRRRH